MPIVILIMIWFIYSYTLLIGCFTTADYEIDLLAERVSNMMIYKSLWLVKRPIILSGLVDIRERVWSLESLIFWPNSTISDELYVLWGMFDTYACTSYYVNLNTIVFIGHYEDRIFTKSQANFLPRSLNNFSLFLH